MATLVSEASVVPAVQTAPATAHQPAVGGGAGALAVVLALAALGTAVSGLVVAGSPSALEWIGAVLVGLWTLAGFALHRRGERLGRLVLLGAALGGVAVLAEALSSDSDDLVVDAALRLSLA